MLGINLCTWVKQHLHVKAFFGMPTNMPFADSHPPGES